jgi:Concanavalin A-like lectin/glucanases superfamily
MKLRAVYGASVLALGAAMVLTPGVVATAATSAQQVSAISQLVTSPPDGGVSSTALSSWQTDGTVFAVAYAKGVVYAGGVFGNARPPGVAAGNTTGEVARTFLAAFNSTTGALITSFDPVITSTSAPPTAGVFSLAVSPDGNTLYVGGFFDHVNGSYRDSLAAFSTSTGALTSWDPAATSKVDTISVSPDGSSVYLGGNFSHLDGVARTYAGAVSSAGAGALLPWAPVVNSTVYSLAVAPDDSQVLLGGYFQTINGVTQNAAGAVDPVTGTTNVPWTANIVPWNPGTCTSTVKNIVISGSTAYVAAEGNGGGCFDGDFAVGLGSTDSLLWQNDCLGATQALAVINGFLYKGSHAHDCAYAPGGFPQVNVPGGWQTWHLLDQSTTNGTLGHFTPPTNNGSTDSGIETLGPHAMATDGSSLFVGGDFSMVDNVAQQGIAIFPVGAGSVPPSNPKSAPTATSSLAGTDTVSFPATSSQDIGTLNYKIFRDGGKTPIATLVATSWPWALPVLSYQDTGLTPGSTHTYTYQASDGIHGTSMSPASAPVTVASANPSASYQATVLGDSPSFFWPLNDSTSTAADASPNGFNGTYESGTTQGVSGPFTGTTATGFDGNSGLVTAQHAVSGPQTFSVEGWFKTSTNDGGKLIGFGGQATGMSSSYDRHIYMMNDGQLVFGVWNNATETIETPDVYNDGQWHYVVATYDATQSGANMALYVDGQLVGTGSSSSAQVYSGFWRVGGDNLNGWNLDPWGSDSQGTTQPAGYYFNGTMANVAVYPTALSAAQVAAHWAAGLNQGG